MDPVIGAFGELRSPRTAGRESRSTARRREAGAIVESSIIVMLGEFGELIGRGVAQALGEDRRIRVLDRGVGVPGRGEGTRWPDVALLDFDVARRSAVQNLRALAPAVGIVALAHRPRRVQRTGSLGEGATCLSKDVSAAELLVAIHLAAERASLHARNVGPTPQPAHASGILALTPRESEVLTWVVAGLTHAKIAHKLHISVETARSHSASIRRKLGVQNNRQLIGITLPAPFKREDDRLITAL